MMRIMRRVFLFALTLCHVHAIVSAMCFITAALLHHRHIMRFCHHARMPYKGKSTRHKYHHRDNAGKGVICAKWLEHALYGLN